MTTITGSNGSDLLTGTAGSDTINSGNGDDIVSGGAGSDSLNGGAGSDTLDGGSGSDQLNGGSGSDTLIYSVSENMVAGTKDVYTGGAGVDTLQLLFTRAQWLDSATQTQIAAYLAHLAAVTNAKTGEVSNGSASDFVFTFGSSTLTVQMTETLAILVDGVEMNPANEAATALGDAATTTEDGPGIQIHVLQNDMVPDLVKSLALASAPAHGTATLVQPAMGDPSTWYFQYQPHAADFQYLAAGESATDTFSYQVTDADGGTGLATATVTITGSNDGPVITAEDLAGAVSEQAAPAGTLSDSGVIGFSDLDLSGVHLVSATGTPVGSVLGSLTAVKDGDTTGTGTSGQLTWTYTVDATAVEYLAAGETRVESFTITVDDQHGGIVTRQIDVTITGTNDAPTIGAADAAAAVTEDAAEPTLSDSGAITFDDADLSDVHGVSVAAGAGNTLGGVLTADVSDAATGAGDGTVSWSYSVANAATQYLAQGQTATETFTVSIDDGHGGTAQQQITVTVTGTNDVPVIGGVASGAVSEDGSTPNLSTSGALTIADVDQGQSNFAPQESTGGSNGHGNFTLAADGTWTYAADNSQSAIQQLGAGQSISDSFTAVSSDGSASQVVTVTITGTNDVPVIGGVATGAVSEDASTPNLSTGGALTIADVDAGQSSFMAQAGTAGSNGYGSFNLLADGNWTYTANNSQAAIQQLAAGQSLSDSFIAVSSDLTASQLVTVTIAGTNDAPVLSAAATPALASVDQGGGAPAGAVGTLVSSLVNLNPPSGGLDNVSDSDNGAITGIALTGANAANGSWWYSTDGGTNWAAVGAVSDTSALLLAADANTRVYFQANSNFSGMVSDGITFRAWDQTSGAAGTTVSTVTNGGSSAFSSATDTASITVDAVNENPVAASDVLYVSNNTAVTLSTSVLLANDTDIDGAALNVTAISVVTGALATPITVNADGTFSFTTGATGGTVGSPTVVTLSYTLSDGAGGSATGSVTLNVLDTTSGANTVDLTGVAAYQGAYIDGKAGGDTLRDGAFQAVLVGSNGNDQLFGNAGSDLLIGGENVDTLDGGAGNDVLRGGNNNDEIDGGAGTEDLIDFSDGLNGVTFTLTQSSGNTVFNGPGSLGTDTYRNIEGAIGTANADTLTGSASNDILRGGGGNDTLDGAGGTGDLLDFSDGTAGLTFTLTQSSSTTSFNASAAGLGTDGYKNFEGVIGTAFGDTITGSALNDQLRGGGGNDAINGLAGDDRISGGTGADILTGGADNDTFVFDSAPNAVDSVTDFNASGSAASGDLVELSLGTFTALSTASGNTLSAAEFASSNGGGAGDAVGAGVHVIYDSATGNLYYDADGLSAANRTLVATLTLSNPADTFDSNDIKVGL